MRKRVIIKDYIAGEKKTLEEIKLRANKIYEVWVVYDKEKMWSTNKFNPHTGQPVKELEDIVLTHGEGVAFEDQLDDWKLSGDTFSYYGRFVKLGNKCDLLIEYEAEENFNE